MDQMEEQSLGRTLEYMIEKLKSKRLADVFRLISFLSAETYGPHKHLRIEINYVKKGSCLLYLDDECVSFKEGETMIIASNTNHTFEAGLAGTTLLQLEFLPELLTGFNFNAENGDSQLNSYLLSSVQNRLIKVANNLPIMRAVQRIVNELQVKAPYHNYLVVMYYAELLILIHRYMNENFLPLCTNEPIKKSIAFIRQNYQQTIAVADIARHAGIGERYLRRLFSIHLQMSPLDYMNKVRIERSLDLLKNTEMTIKEICFQCGFKSPQYFSRVFKSQIGIPPSDVLG